MGEEPEVRQRVVQPRSAERAEDGDPGRASPDRLEQRQLRVRLVLVRGCSQDLEPVALRRVGDRGIHGVQVTDEEVRVEAEPAGA